eukprot:TRINITY_DN5747_c0_g1_i2.p1 TRINITY_DN5747_c0_g1~~TRINITY_DN5747_c0_g1_i2.p1  ORF type:complete len:148 (+),score=43.21 TRINITY_DN5747_c0_g1_i2:428-871(+)
MRLINWEGAFKSCILQELLQVGCHGDCHQQHNRELEVVVVGLEVEAGRVEHQAEQSQSSRVPLIRARIAATARSLSLPLLMISMVSMRLIRSPASSDLCKPAPCELAPQWHLSLIHISEPTRLLSISYAVFCLKKKKKKKKKKKTTI